MYCRITSSVTLPLLAAKYPLAHKCLPQNCRRRCANSISNLWLVLPFRYCIILLTDRYGGTDTNKWTWSLPTCPFTISMSLTLQISPPSSRTPVPTGPTPHPPPVVGDPNQVILKIVFRVTGRPVYLHMDVLPQGFA